MRKRKISIQELNDVFGDYEWIVNTQFVVQAFEVHHTHCYYDPHASNGQIIFGNGSCFNAVPENLVKDIENMSETDDDITNFMIHLSPNSSIEFCRE